MSGVNNSGRAACAPELIQAMTGSDVTIGSLIANPVIIIFDNLSTTSVVLKWNGVQFKTFAGGEAMVLDMRAAKGMASNYTFSIGDTFVANGAANGSFSISYTYAVSN